MKRKDTKTYKKIIEKYCDLRYIVETISKDLKILRNRLFEKEMLKTEQNDPKVINVIDSVIRLSKFGISLNEDRLKSKTLELKKYEEILINDYGDNPDVIYKIYNKNNF